MANLPNPTATQEFQRPSTLATVGPPSGSVYQDVRGCILMVRGPALKATQRLTYGMFRSSGISEDYEANKTVKLIRLPVVGLECMAKPIA